MPPQWLQHKSARKSLGILEREHAVEKCSNGAQKLARVALEAARMSVRPKGTVMPYTKAIHRSEASRYNQVHSETVHEWPHDPNGSNYARVAVAPGPCRKRLIITGRSLETV